MDVIGIIAEYNPFHRGHHWQIDELRCRLGGDTAVVAVMSGNWVQRGDAAISDKWARTRMALEGGADLILELPTLWAVSSAESFAFGGVSILQATGLVNRLCFSSESGQLEGLQAAARCLNSPEYTAALSRHTGQGISFASARQAAVEELLGETAALLSAPNNNLGVEYLRALDTLGSTIQPMTLPRQGAAHDSWEEHEYPSASLLRQKILSGELAWDDPAALQFNQLGVLSVLRRLTPEDLALLPDCSEGLHNRLYQAIQTSTTLEQLYDTAKTKRYAHARIRRLVLWAYLGLREQDRPQLPPYLRVLGAGPKGRTLLRQLEQTASLPVITKPAHAKRLDAPARTLFELEARCTDLYVLCRRSGPAPCGLEWTTSPVMV